jgi:hypothetical protein
VVGGGGANVPVLGHFGRPPGGPPPIPPIPGIWAWVEGVRATRHRAKLTNCRREVFSFMQRFLSMETVGIYGA